MSHEAEELYGSEFRRANDAWLPTWFGFYIAVVSIGATIIYIVVFWKLGDCVGAALLLPYLGVVLVAKGLLEDTVHRNVQDRAVRCVRERSPIIGCATV